MPVLTKIRQVWGESYDSGRVVLTASIFRRYDIVAESDLRDAACLLDQKREIQFGHSSAIEKPQSQPKKNT